LKGKAMTAYARPERCEVKMVNFRIDFAVEEEYVELMQREGDL